MQSFAEPIAEPEPFALADPEPEPEPEALAFAEPDACSLMNSFSSMKTLGFFIYQFFF